MLGKALEETMNVRAYLDAREQELIEALRGLHARIRPLELELFEVRSAKRALGLDIQADGRVIEKVAVPPPPTTARELLNTLEQIERQQRPRRLIKGVQSGCHIEIFDTVDVSDKVTVFTPSSPYEKMTMKQLVVKALREHFAHSGATTQELLNYFKDVWGREIPRGNLTAQISRLYRDSVIGRANDRRWFLLGNPQVEQLTAKDSDPAVEILIEDDERR